MTRDINNMAIMKSIKPKYCELIIAGKKTIELRKSRPKVPPPVKVYIYCTMPKCEDDIIFNEFEALNGKVICEYVCNKIDEIHIPTELLYEKAINKFSERTLNILNQSCLSYDEIVNYSGCNLNDYNTRKEFLYAWHISNLVIYDEIYNKPKSLSEFMVIDKEMLKECPYRIRAYNNPDCTNGALLKGTYVCNNSFEPDFCRGQCGIATKPLTRPPQSWCYVEEKVKSS